MSDEEKYRLRLVLYHVSIIRNKTVALESSLNKIYDKINANCLIDDENPKERQLDDISNDVTDSVSTYNNQVIPSLINRINS